MLWAHSGGATSDRDGAGADGVLKCLTLIERPEVERRPLTDRLPPQRGAAELQFDTAIFPIVGFTVPNAAVATFL